MSQLTHPIPPVETYNLARDLRANPLPYPHKLCNSLEEFNDAPGEAACLLCDDTGCHFCRCKSA
jgi:hypothetical protein